MKRILVMLLLITSIMLAGCGKKAEPVIIDVADLADSLRSEIEFQDELTELNKDMVESLYSISPADVVKQKIYVSSGATAEEIAAFEGKDKESTKRIQDALTQRVEDLKTNFESYMPEEMEKLNKAVLAKQGNYIILCIADDSDKAKKMIQNYGQNQK